MKRLFFYLAVMATGFSMPSANAQYVKAPLKPEGPVWDVGGQQEDYRKKIIENLEKEKENIVEQEKYNLKNAVEKIASQEDEGTLTAEQARAAKEEAAKRAALNIDNKKAIIENQIELAKRDEPYTFEPDKGGYVELGLGNAYDAKGSALLGFRYNAENLKVKYDKRTTSDIVIATGLNGTIGDGQEIGGDYRFGKSNYSELGIAFRTRLRKDSNTFRLAYGLSYQLNSLSLRDNKYFVNNQGTTTAEVFPHTIKKTYFTMHNLVVPVHIEFGPSIKREYKDYFRYDTNSKFKAGIGGYAGMNVAAVQYLKYSVDGVKFSDRTRSDYNVNKFVYGLSAYAGVGSISFYVKYDLNPVFENSLYKDHNIAFALRLDL